MQGLLNCAKEEQMLRVLHISEVSSGGILPYIADISNNLIDEFEFYYAYGIRFDTPTNIEEYFDKRVHLIPVMEFTRSISLSRDVRALVKIKKLVRKINPDIIHLHSSKAGVLGRWAVNGKEYKVFYTPHCYSFLKKDDSRFKRLIYFLIEWISARRKSTTIVTGRSEYELAKNITKHVVLAENGIDISKIDMFDLGNHKKENERIKIYTAGRIGMQKNPDLFNEIAKLCPNMDFVWVGDGDEKYRLTSKNIRITGLIPIKEQFEEFYSSDAFVLCSQWEVSPCSILNAFYLRIPVFVNNIPGNMDAVGNDTGYICSNAQEFRDQLKEHTKNRDEKLLDKAQNSVVDFFNAKAMSDRIKKIYLTAYDKDDV